MSAEIIFIILFIFYAGFLLSTPEGKVGKADVIVILGGGTAERLRKGLELYNQGFSNKLLITGFPYLIEEVMPSYVKWRVQYLVESGIPEENLFFDGVAKNSIEEAFLVKTFLTRHKINRVLIVSDPPHLRRLHYIYSSVFKSDKAMEFNLIPSEPLWWDSDKWWANSRSAQFVILEVIKNFYLFSKSSVKWVAKSPVVLNWFVSFANPNDKSHVDS